MQPTESRSFVYANPRTIHWGSGNLADHLEVSLKQVRRQRAFVVSTRSVSAHAELGGRLREILGPRLLGEFAGISQHAPAAAVTAAVEAAREARPDILISFGGGSPIDAAKSVAFALATRLELRDPHAADRARVLATRCALFGFP